MSESPIDLWNVTTEGDCEGRSIKHLGCYQGHFVDIAFALRKHSFYVLNFARGKDFKASPDDGSAAGVYVRVEGLKPDNSWYQSNLPRGVTAKRGNYYESIELTRGPDIEKIKASALAKLTPDERKALGYA